MTGARGLFGRLRGGGGDDPPARPDRVRLSHVGFVGKLPSAGDFIARGVPSAERDRFERFLNAGLRDIAADPGFGDKWSVMPIWRFAARPGAITEALCLGIVLPSVDRVGRRFPLAVLALGAPGADADPDALLTAAAPFLADAEAAALRALDPSSSPDAAFADLMTRRELPAPAPGVSGGAAAVWETDGGRTGAPARLPSAGPPPPAATLRAMLDAAGDPQAAMAAMAAAAPAPEAPLFAAHAPADPAPDAPIFAPPPDPAHDDAPLFAPSAPSPAAEEEEPPLFPEAPRDAAANPAPTSAQEQVKLAQEQPAPTGPASQEAPEARDPADPDPATEDNVFAAAYRSMAAETSAARGDAPASPRGDDHAGASAPPESAPQDGGERS